MISAMSNGFDGYRLLTSPESAFNAFISGMLCKVPLEIVVHDIIIAVSKRRRLSSLLGGERRDVVGTWMLKGSHSIVHVGFEALF